MTYLNFLIEHATINLSSQSVIEKKKEKLQPFQTRIYIFMPVRIINCTQTTRIVYR